MWDAQQWHYVHETEVERGRIAVGRLERAGEPEGERWHIVNVYMPVRVQGAAERRRDEPMWHKLSDTLAQFDTRSVIVLGDLNAEPGTWLRMGNGIRHWANDELENICTQG